MTKNDESNSEIHEKVELSVCDIMKDDTSETIKKLESQIPLLVQNYSDLYTEYLHMFDDLFGTCYIAEKKFFDKLNIDQKILRQIKKNSEAMKNHYLNNVDMTSKLFDTCVRMQISTVKSFDNYIHVMMDSYTKILPSSTNLFSYQNNFFNVYKANLRLI